MQDPRQVEQFVQQLTACQDRLYAYITALLPDLDQARDVLQETNLVLWRKAEEFVIGTEFGAWAARVAYFQVLAHRKRRRRDRHVFDDDLLSDIAQEAALQLADDERQQALKRCVDQLPGLERELIRMRYSPDGSVKQIAAQLGRTVGAVSQSLYRIRLVLIECVDRRLTPGPGGPP